jgi:hypothetical protein
MLPPSTKSASKSTTSCRCATYASTVRPALGIRLPQNSGDTHTRGVSCPAVHSRSHRASQTLSTRSPHRPSPAAVGTPSRTVRHASNGPSTLLLPPASHRAAPINTSSLPLPPPPVRIAFRPPGVSRRGPSICSVPRIQALPPCLPGEE